MAIPARTFTEEAGYLLARSSAAPWSHDGAI